MIVIYHILEKYIVTEKVTTTLVLCIFPNTFKTTYEAHNQSIK